MQQSRSVINVSLLRIGYVQDQVAGSVASDQVEIDDFNADSDFGDFLSGLQDAWL